MVTTLHDVSSKSAYNIFHMLNREQNVLGTENLIANGTPSFTGPYNTWEKFGRCFNSASVVSHLLPSNYSASCNILHPKHLLLDDRNQSISETGVLAAANSFTEDKTSSKPSFTGSSHPFISRQNSFQLDFSPSRSLLFNSADAHLRQTLDSNSSSAFSSSAVSPTHRTFASSDEANSPLLSSSYVYLPYDPYQAAHLCYSSQHLSTNTVDTNQDNFQRDGDIIVAWNRNPQFYDPHVVASLLSPPYPPGVSDNLICTNPHIHNSSGGAHRGSRLDNCEDELNSKNSIYFPPPLQRGDSEASLMSIIDERAPFETSFVAIQKDGEISQLHSSGCIHSDSTSQQVISPFSPEFLEDSRKNFLPSYNQLLHPSTHSTHHQACHHLVPYQSYHSPVSRLHLLPPIHHQALHLASSNQSLASPMYHQNLPSIPHQTLHLSTSHHALQPPTQQEAFHLSTHHETTQSPTSHLIVYPSGHSALPANAISFCASSKTLDTQQPLHGDSEVQKAWTERAHNNGTASAAYLDSSTPVAWTHFTNLSRAATHTPSLPKGNTIFLKNAKEGPSKKVLKKGGRGKAVYVEENKPPQAAAAPPQHSNERMLPSNFLPALPKIFLMEGGSEGNLSSSFVRSLDSSGMLVANHGVHHGMRNPPISAASSSMWEERVETPSFDEAMVRQGCDLISSWGLGQTAVNSSAGASEWLGNLSASSANFPEQYYSHPADNTMLYPQQLHDGYLDESAAMPLSSNTPKASCSSSKTRRKHRRKVPISSSCKHNKAQPAHCHPSCSAVYSGELLSCIPEASEKLRGSAMMQYVQLSPPFYPSDILAPSVDSAETTLQWKKQQCSNPSSFPATSHIGGSQNLLHPFSSDPCKDGLMNQPGMIPLSSAYEGNFSLKAGDELLTRTPEIFPVDGFEKVAAKGVNSLTEKLHLRAFPEVSDSYACNGESHDNFLPGWHEERDGGANQSSKWKNVFTPPTCTARFVSPIAPASSSIGTLEELHNHFPEKSTSQCFSVCGIFKELGDYSIEEFGHEGIAGDSFGDGSIDNSKSNSFVSSPSSRNEGADGNMKPEPKLTECEGNSNEANDLLPRKRHAQNCGSEISTSPSRQQGRDYCILSDDKVILHPPHHYNYHPDPLEEDKRKQKRYFFASLNDTAYVQPEIPDLDGGVFKGFDYDLAGATNTKQPLGDITSWFYSIGRDNVSLQRDGNEDLLSASESVPTGFFLGFKMMQSKDENVLQPGGNDDKLRTSHFEASVLKNGSLEGDAASSETAENVTISEYDSIIPSPDATKKCAGNQDGFLELSKNGMPIGAERMNLRPAASAPGVLQSNSCHPVHRIDNFVSFWTGQSFDKNTETGMLSFPFSSSLAATDSLLDSLSILPSKIASVSSFIASSTQSSSLYASKSFPTSDSCSSFSTPASSTSLPTLSSSSSQSVLLPLSFPSSSSSFSCSSSSSTYTTPSCYSTSVISSSCISPSLSSSSCIAPYSCSSSPSLNSSLTRSSLTSSALCSSFSSSTPSSSTLSSPSFTSSPLAFSSPSTPFSSLFSPSSSASSISSSSSCASQLGFLSLSSPSSTSFYPSASEFIDRGNFSYFSFSSSSHSPIHFPKPYTSVSSHSRASLSPCSEEVLKHSANGFESQVWNVSHDSLPFLFGCTSDELEEVSCGAVALIDARKGDCVMDASPAPQLDSAQNLVQRVSVNGKICTPEGVAGLPNGVMHTLYEAVHSSERIAQAADAATAVANNLTDTRGPPSGAPKTASDHVEVANTKVLSVTHKHPLLTSKPCLLGSSGKNLSLGSNISGLEDSASLNVGCAHDGLVTPCLSATRECEETPHVDTCNSYSCPEFCDYTGNQSDGGVGIDGLVTGGIVEESNYATESPNVRNPCDAGDYFPLNSNKTPDNDASTINEPNACDATIPDSDTPHTGGAVASPSSKSDFSAVTAEAAVDCRFNSCGSFASMSPFVSLPALCNKSCLIDRKEYCYTRENSMANDAKKALEEDASSASDAATRSINVSTCHSSHAGMGYDAAHTQYLLYDADCSTLCRVSGVCSKSSNQQASDQLEALKIGSSASLSSPCGGPPNLPLTTLSKPDASEMLCANSEDMQASVIRVANCSAPPFTSSCNASSGDFSHVQHSPSSLTYSFNSCDNFATVSYLHTDSMKNQPNSSSESSSSCVPSMSSSSAFSDSHSFALNMCISSPMRSSWPNSSSSMRASLRASSSPTHSPLHSPIALLRVPGEVFNALDSQIRDSHDTCAVGCQSLSRCNYDSDVGILSSLPSLLGRDLCTLPPLFDDEVSLQSQSFLPDHTDSTTSFMEKDDGGSNEQWDLKYHADELGGEELKNGQPNAGPGDSGEEELGRLMGESAGSDYDCIDERSFKDDEMGDLKDFFPASRRDYEQLTEEAVEEDLAIADAEDEAANDAKFDAISLGIHYSPCKGVYFDRQKETWRAEYNPLPSARYHRSFACNKYGFESAKLMAVQARNEMELLHGKGQGKKCFKGAIDRGLFIPNVRFVEKRNSWRARYKHHDNCFSVKKHGYHEAKARAIELKKFWITQDKGNIKDKTPLMENSKSSTTESSDCSSTTDMPTSQNPRNTQSPLHEPTPSRPLSKELTFWQSEQDLSPPFHHHSNALNRLHCSDRNCVNCSFSPTRYAFTFNEDFLRPSPAHQQAKIPTKSGNSSSFAHIPADEALINDPAFPLSNYPYLSCEALIRHSFNVAGPFDAASQRSHQRSIEYTFHPSNNRSFFSGAASAISCVSSCKYPADDCLVGGEFACYYQDEAGKRLLLDGWKAEFDQAARKEQLVGSKSLDSLFHEEEFGKKRESVGLPGVQFDEIKKCFKVRFKKDGRIVRRIFSVRKFGYNGAKVLAEKCKKDACL